MLERQQAALCGFARMVCADAPCVFVTPSLHCRMLPSGLTSATRSTRSQRSWRSCVRRPWPDVLLRRGKRGWPARNQRTPRRPAGKLAGESLLGWLLRGNFAAHHIGSQGRQARHHASSGPLCPSLCSDHSQALLTAHTRHSPSPRSHHSEYASSSPQLGPTETLTGSATRSPHTLAASSITLRTSAAAVGT